MLNLNRKQFALLLMRHTFIVLTFLFIAFIADTARAHGIEKASTYHLIYEYIIKANCTSASCHNSAKPSGGLNMENETVAYESLVGIDPKNPLAKEQGLKRVDPYYPEHSFLMFKITKPLEGHGSPMPRGLEPIPKRDIDVIRRWVVAGAPKDGKVKDIAVIGESSRSSSESDESETSIFAPPAPPESGFQVQLKPFDIAPGGEREISYAMKMPIAEDVLVNRIDIIQPHGSHHFLLYRILGDKVPESGYRTLSAQDRPHDGVDRQLVAGAQTANTTMTFPKGVGIKIYASSYYDFNSHFINLNQKEALHGEVYINFHTIEPDKIERVANPFLISNGHIKVSPGQKVETADSWIVSEDIELVILASHMHRHGEHFVATRLDNTPIYQTDDWEDPGFLMFDPPILLKKGDGLRYIATHNNNDKPYPIRFGYTSEDEMAIIFGYYVPVKNQSN